MYIAIDIGGSNIRIALFDNLENPELLSEKHFLITNNYANDMQAVIDAIRDLSGDKEIDAIGIGCAGPIDKTKSYILNSPNLSDWQGKPIKMDISRAFSAPVFLDNDAIAAASAIAEYCNVTEDFWLFTWGTGFGGTFVSIKDGKIGLFSSEPGHQIITTDGRLCGCGQHGCLEAYIGGGPILKYLGKSMLDLNEEEWIEVERTASLGIINALAVRYASKIFLTGGVILNQPQRVENIKRYINETIKIHPAPSLTLSKFGEDTGIYGALALIKLKSI